MPIRRAAHAVYDLTYHLVWIPKDRNTILTKEVATYVNGVFHQVAEQYDMVIDRVEGVEAHIHMLVSVPPRSSPAQVGQRMKSMSAREVFRQFPE